MRVGCRALLLLVLLVPPAGAEDAALAPVTARAPAPLPGEAERAPAATQTTVDVRARAGEAATLPELLASVPGAVVRDYGGPGQLATLSLRGASPQEVLVLLDGVPLTSAAGAGVNLATLPPSFLERLEVVRGSVGAIYGPGAMGGMVNLVSRTPEAGPPLLSASVTGGSFGTAELAATGSGSVGPGALLLTATALDTQGDFPFLLPHTDLWVNRLNNDVRQLGTLGRYRLTVGGGALEVHAEVEGEDRGLAGTALNPTPNDRFGEDREVLSLGYAHALGAGQVELRPYFRRERTMATLGGMPGPAEVDAAGGIEARSRQVLGNHALALVASAAGEQLSGASPQPYARPELAVGASDEWLLASGRLSLLPAVRVDRVEAFTGFSPQLAAAFRPLDGLELRASLGRSFRAPTLTELYVDQGLVAPNPRLQPESGSTAELSLAWSRGALSAQAAAFASVYQDLIVYELYPPFRLEPFNFATAGIAGAELEGSWRAWRSLSLSLAYGYQRTADLYDIAAYYGSELPYHPRHHGDARLAWAGSRVRAQLEGLAQSSQNTNRVGTDPLGPRLLANAGVAVRPLADAPFWLGLEAKNLLDDQTEDLYGYPLPGRALYASLRFDTTPQESR